ncbi:putative acetyl-CoA carboxylase, biotin carboxylase subunit [Bordetella bronchiseptica RB630]|nr:putative acetyl-CoA carboxylase, biotin carboxylase subunit [Bordetella bronchiseptica 3E44]KDD54666.1 putative acetyl-CoA carboxylase, biotin carboxylase subunit [Bordetella bronchiseptica RB630]
MTSGTLHSRGQSMRLKKVLIANRGEIALRIVRACREMDIRTVQVYSSADEDSLPVRLADEAVPIGGPEPSASYLNIAALIAAAREHGCDAIHPGYGFLSENEDFAQACIDAGIVFIGPDPGAIRMMGDKAQARKIAKEAGVPIVPGSPEPVSDVEEAIKVAREVGYPLLVKAAAGGGGRGMRVIQGEAQLREGLERASMEAKSAFGDGSVYIERYISPVRHVEIQVFGDGEDVIHLGERECSIQRRHQKLLEESPSPVLSEETRQRMGEAACALARAVKYRGAGTLEFVMDGKSGEFFFIEMNTRIQVEHPVTEAVTGVDLVRLQLAVAAGGRLGLRQQDIVMKGHAIECRINAEDPQKAFMPSPGTVNDIRLPSGPGVRMDSHVYRGYKLPPYYDSLLGKLIVWDESREKAIARMLRALGELEIVGVKTTKEFHERLMRDEDFIAANVNTQFVKEKLYADHPMRHLL